MKEVKRYYMTGGQSGYAEVIKGVWHQEGVWIKEDDYDALLAERDLLLAIKDATVALDESNASRGIDSRVEYHARKSALDAKRVALDAWKAAQR